MPAMLSKAMPFRAWRRERKALLLARALRFALLRG